MPLLALLSGYTLIVYLCLAALTVIKNPRGRVNWSLAALLLAFAAWSLEDVFHGDNQLSPERVQYFSDIGTVGRCSFASLFLLFALVYTRQRRLLRSWPVILLLVGVPAFFCYVLWSRLIVPVNQRFSFGWTVTWPNTFWSLLFYGSYLLFMAAALFLLARHRVRAALPQERTQATIVLVSSLVALILGTITDVVLPGFTSVRIPELASMLALIMAGGIYIAVTRFGMASVAAAAAPQEILQTMADSMLLLDPTGRIMSCNNAARSLFGYSRVEMTGRPAAELFARPDDFAGHLAHVAADGIIPRADIAGRSREGREIPLSTSGRLMHDPTGEAVGSVWILRDVSDLRRVETRLQRLADDLRILNVLAVELAAAPNEADIFRILAERMRALADARVVAISEYDQAARTLKVRAFVAEPEVVAAVNELLGRDIRELRIPISPESLPRLLRQPVSPLAAIGDASFGDIPPQLMATLQRAFGIESLSGIALFDEDELLGTAVVAYRAGSEPLPDDIMRTYANMAAVYLRRKRIEAALRESEEKYRNLVERASDGIVIIQDARIIYCNPRLAEMNGTSVEDVLGTPFTEHIHPDQLPLLAERYQRRIAGEPVSPTYETVLRTVHGDPVPVEINAGIINYQGRPADMIIVRDITERKQAEAALREGEERYRFLFESAPVGITVSAEDARILAANDHMSQLTGYTRDELLAMRSPQLYPNETDSAPVRAELDRSGLVNNREVVIRRKDGTLFTALLNVQPSELGGQRVYFRTLRDITERKRAEEKLRRYTERLELLHELDLAIANARSTELIAETVLSRSRQMLGCDRASITLFNPAAGTARVIAVDARTVTRIGTGREIPLSDMPVAELKQGNIVRIEDIRATSHPPGTHQALLAEGMHSIMNVPLIVQGELIGSFNVGASRAAGFGPEEEEVARQLAAEMSIALHQSRLEEELRRRAAELEDRVAERTAQLEAANRELEAFSYSVSHDLRAPLRSLDGFSQALLEDYAGRLDDAAREHLRRIRNASQRMARLIDDLLQLSRVSRGELRRERIDLSRMAGEVMAEFRAAEPGRAVEFRVMPNLRCRGDPRLVRIALVNLLGNAWKFSAGRADARIEFERGTDESQVAYLVRDNGAGFDMSYAARLGAPFQRLHTESEFPGSGIGLATVRRIVQRHGGRLWWKSAPGQGATFFFTMPGNGNPRTNPDARHRNMEHESPKDPEQDARRRPGGS